MNSFLARCLAVLAFALVTTLVGCKTRDAIRPPEVSPVDVSTGDLVAQRPAAARVFFRHGIDFCCGGRGTLASAAAARGLDAGALLAEIDAAEREGSPTEEARWDARPARELIAHIVERYHARLRSDLPRLLDLSRKVDRAHAARDDRPVGLTEHLTTMSAEILQHLGAEEQDVFPRIVAGRALRSDEGVHRLVHDHEALGRALARTREITKGFTLPADACPTWRALYAGLADLEREIMVHAHLENNVLFRRLPAA